MKIGLRFNVLLTLTLLLGATPVRAQFWSALPMVTSDSLQSVSFSQDEQHVYFLSDKSGVRNIWMVPVRGGAAVQITKFTDHPVVRAEHLLYHPYLVFMRAVSVDGKDFHIFKIRDDGSGAAEDLTQTDAGVWNDIAGMSYNGTYVYFRSNNYIHSKTDVWRYDVGQNTTEDIFPNDKDYQLLAWSRDQTRLLMEEPLSGELLFIDAASTEHIPLETPATPFRQAMMDPLNNELYTLDSAGNLRARELATGKKRDLLTGVSYFNFSPNGKYIVEKSGGAWSVIEAATNTPVALPTGAIPVAIAVRENLTAYTIGNKLFVFDVSKKASTELTTLD